MKKKSNKLLFIVLGVAFVALIAMVIFGLVRGNRSSDGSSGGEGPAAVWNVTDEIKAAEAADGMTQICDMVFPATGTVGEFMDLIENSSVNWSYSYNEDRYITSNTDLTEIDISYDGEVYFYFSVSCGHETTVALKDAYAYNLTITTAGIAAMPHGVYFYSGLSQNGADFPEYAEYAPLLKEAYESLSESDEEGTLVGTWTVEYSDGALEPVKECMSEDTSYTLTYTVYVDAQTHECRMLMLTPGIDSLTYAHESVAETAAEEVNPDIDTDAGEIVVDEETTERATESVTLSEEEKAEIASDIQDIENEQAAEEVNEDIDTDAGEIIADE